MTKNKIKCPYCNNVISLPGSSVTKLKPATIEAIMRIESKEVRGLLMMDSDHRPSELVEGYFGTLAQAICRYQETVSPNEKVEDNPVDDKSQLDLFRVAMVE